MDWKLLFLKLEFRRNKNFDPRLPATRKPSAEREDAIKAGRTGAEEDAIPCYLVMARNCPVLRGRVSAPRGWFNAVSDCVYRCVSRISGTSPPARSTAAGPAL